MTKHLGFADSTLRVLTRPPVNPMPCCWLAYSVTSWFPGLKGGSGPPRLFPGTYSSLRELTRQPGSLPSTRFIEMSRTCSVGWRLVETQLDITLAELAKVQQGWQRDSKLTASKGVHDQSQPKCYKTPS